MEQGIRNSVLHHLNQLNKLGTIPPDLLGQYKETITGFLSVGNDIMNLIAENAAPPAAPFAKSASSETESGNVHVGFEFPDEIKELIDTYTKLISERSAIAERQARAAEAIADANKRMMNITRIIFIELYTNKAAKDFPIPAETCATIIQELTIEHDNQTKHG